MVQENKSIHKVDMPHMYKLTIEVDMTKKNKLTIEVDIVDEDNSSSPIDNARDDKSNWKDGMNKQFEMTKDIVMPNTKIPKGRALVNPQVKGRC
jgi:hypothetical protein